MLLGGHGCKLRKRVFSSNHLLNCFTNRAVDCWNALPEEIVNARSYSAFSYKIRHMDLTKFLKGCHKRRKSCTGIPI